MSRDLPYLPSLGSILGYFQPIASNMAGYASQGSPSRPRNISKSPPMFTQTAAYHNSPSPQGSNWGNNNGSWVDLNLEPGIRGTARTGRGTTESGSIPQTPTSSRCSNGFDPTAAVLTPSQHTSCEGASSECPPGSLSISAEEIITGAEQHLVSALNLERGRGSSDTYHEASQIHTHEVAGLFDRIQRYEQNGQIAAGNYAHHTAGKVIIELGDLKEFTHCHMRYNLALQTIAQELYGHGSSNMSALQGVYKTLANTYANIHQILTDESENWWRDWLETPEPASNPILWYGTDTVPVLPTDPLRTFNITVGSVV